jgi:ATP-dependent DNA helicase RecG
MPSDLSGSLLYLKGVGPQRAQALAARGIATIEDLLSYLPFRYEDRTRFTPVSQLLPGQVATVLAIVQEGALLRFRHRRAAAYNLIVRDEKSLLHARFFHGTYLERQFRPGQRVVLHGKANFDPYHPGRLEMTNPEFEILSDSARPADSTEVGRIVPIYEAIGGVSSRMFRRIIYSVLQQLGAQIAEVLPAELLDRLRLPTRATALAGVHFPPAEADLDELNSFRSIWHRRMIFEEFFRYQLGVALRRQEASHRTGLAMRIREQPIRDAVRRILPFRPTAAQKRVLGEIVADLERPVPMLRLLEGDVGSGKTIVALEAATIVIENGYQTVLMAPTEILAVQHFLFTRRIFASAGYRVELLVSGMKRAEKTAAIEAIRSGGAQCVVGTHALLEQKIEFPRLGLVIVDEQHRFGVLQRKQLMEKGRYPHVLVMTATPIPRTLALTLYGDLDLSVIDEMPPGRTPIETRWTPETRLPGEWDFLRRQAAAGRQAFVVYPVIEESKQERKAATAEFERLSAGELKSLRLGLLHGRMPRDEKDSAMERFRAGEIQVLVSTSVVEVGVDVPNASVMVIEHADRFGLAQLHQLRGRIGRGAAKSYCILATPNKVSEVAQERLQIMVDTVNGFEIAEKDLAIRGPGEFFGTRQHGDHGLSFAHPLRDIKILEAARTEAFALAEDPTRAAILQRIIAGLGPGWARRFDLAMVG